MNKNLSVRDSVRGKKRKKSHSATSGHISSNRKVNACANNDVCLAAIESKLFGLYLYIVCLKLLAIWVSQRISVILWLFYGKDLVRFKWANST